MTRAAPPVLILAKRDPQREATGFASPRRVGRQNRGGSLKGEAMQPRRWPKPTGAPGPWTRIHPETAGGSTERSAAEKQIAKRVLPKKPKPPSEPF
jgi:hypothetical protein